MAIPGTHIPQFPLPPVAPPVPSPGPAQAPLPTAGGGAQLDWLRQLLGGQQQQGMPQFRPDWLQQYIVKRKRARYGPSWQPPAAEPADVTAPGFADPGQFGQGTAFQWLNNRLRA